MGALDGLDLTGSNLIDELGLLLGASQDRELVLGLESQESRQDGGSEVSSTAYTETKVSRLPEPYRTTLPTNLGTELGIEQTLW